MKTLTKYLPLVMVVGGLIIFQWAVFGQEMEYGGKEDVAFAENLWKAMDGYENWKIKTGVYPGTSPHGKFLRTYYSIVNVKGEDYHVIIKDNYGGEGATMEKVKNSPMEHLAAVTVMVQREPGYDKETGNWYWVKYMKDGSVAENEKGVKIAGSYAVGTDKGCIDCHAKAKGGDYFFTND